MRIWQVQFQITKPLASLPVPRELVKEIQTGPEYHLEGRNRNFAGGGQMAVTLEGEGAFREDREIYPLKPGTAFLALHNDPKHAYFYPKHAKDPWIFLWISFVGPAAEALIEDMVARYGYIHSFSIEHRIIKKLMSYQDNENSARLMSPFPAASLVLDVLNVLSEKDERELLKRPRNTLVQTIRQIMMEEVENDFGVNELSERLRITREHLSRVFKEETGVRLGEYIKFNKMRRARQMLRDTLMPGKEIAIRLGYESQSSFNRAFKRHFDTTPENYRRTGLTPKFDWGQGF